MFPLSTVAAVIGFEETIYSASESSGVIEVAVAVLQGELSDDVPVRIFTEDGTALSSSDYTSVDQIFTFSPTSTRITISVSISDDSIDEDNEYFRGRLELNQSVGERNVQIEPDEAQLLILDDDGVLLLFLISATYFQYSLLQMLLLSLKSRIILWQKMVLLWKCVLSFLWALWNAM